MANPQMEGGYTPISNELLEQVYRLKLNGTQFKIIMVVWRFTYGFSRKEHELSELFIANAANINRKQVSRELRELIKSNIICVVKDASYTTSRVIRFNKNYEGWKLFSGQGAKQQTVNQLEGTTGSGLVDLTGSGLDPQENNIKTNIKQAKNLHSDEEELKKNFEIIYSIYPKKVGKQTAYENYKKWIVGRRIDNKKIKLTNRQIYIAVRNYVSSKEEMKTELQYYKDFSTLMGKQLLDYIVEEGEEDAG